jgi:hypothetical protein
VLVRIEKTPAEVLPWNFGGERDVPGDEGRMNGDSSPMACLIGESGPGKVDEEPLSATDAAALPSKTFAS